MDCRKIFFEDMGYEWVLKHLPFLTVVVGFLVLVSGSFFDWKIAETTGTTVLAAGVFSSLLKSYQFKGVFHQDLESIVYSEKYLGTLKNPFVVLRTLMRGQLSDRFPGWTEEYLDVVLQEYVPTNHTYYIEDIERRLHVTRDENDVDFLLLEDVVTCRYYPDSTAGDHKYSIPARIRKAAVKGDQFFDSLTIEVDGIDCTAAISESEPVEINEGGERLLLFERSLLLPKTERERPYYDIIRRSRRRQNIAEDPHMRVYAQSFIKGYALRISGLDELLDQGVCCEFINSGVRVNFLDHNGNDEVPSDLNGDFYRYTPELILPRQGYILAFIVRGQQGGEAENA